MRNASLFGFLVVCAACFLASCAHLDTSLDPAGQMVLSGTVNFRSDEPLPSDALVVVRLLDVTRADSPPQVLAEQIQKGALSSPVPFSFEYKAEDIQPPKRANLEARISIGGRLRYSSMNRVAVTPLRAEGPIQIWIEELPR